MEELKEVEDAMEEEYAARGEEMPERWAEKGMVYYTPPPTTDSHQAAMTS